MHTRYMYYIQARVLVCSYFVLTDVVVDVERRKHGHNVRVVYSYVILVITVDRQRMRTVRRKCATLEGNATRLELWTELAESLKCFWKTTLLCMREQSKNHEEGQTTEERGDMVRYIMTNYHTKPFYQIENAWDKREPWINNTYMIRIIINREPI